jgi:hypothetical protein
VDARPRLGALRLESKDDLQRSEVFRSQDDELTAGETWKRRARDEVAVSERFLPDSTTTRSVEAVG